MVRPLNFEELDRLVASATFCLIENANWILLVLEIILKIDGLVINCTSRVLEAFL
jgi:hypothetical protein